MKKNNNKNKKKEKNMLTLILGIIVCVITLCIFIYLRVTKGGLAGVLSKTVASFCFIALSLLLLAQKIGLNAYFAYGASALVLGLVCGLIGDILLDLKVVYNFNKGQFLYAGMTSFLVGHLFFTASMILFSIGEINIFTTKVYILIAIFAGTILLTFLIWLLSTKVMKLNYERFTAFVNCYSFVLLFTTALSIYLGIIVKSLPMYILSGGFVAFLLSDLVLSTQYFGGKLMDKKLIVINHLLYYIAQITIASFVYFI